MWLTGWASHGDVTSGGYGWLVPLLTAAIVSVGLAAVRSQRSYAVAVVLGTLSGVFAALLVVADAMSHWD